MNEKGNKNRAHDLKELFAYKYTLFFLIVIILLITGLYYLSADSVKIFSIREIASTIILSLIGAFVVAIVFDVFVRKTFIEAVSQSTRNSVEDIIEGYSSTFGSGIVNVHPNINYQILQEHAQTSKSIKILQTVITDTSYAMNLIKAVAQKDGAVIEILFCNPGSAYILSRAQELGRNPEKLQNDFEEFVNQVRRLPFEFVEKINFKVYDGTPAFSMYAFDDVIFSSRFLIEKDSVACSQIEARRLGQYFDESMKHFEQAFVRSKPWPIHSNLNQTS